MYAVTYSHVMTCILSAVFVASLPRLKSKNFRRLRIIYVSCREQ